MNIGQHLCWCCGDLVSLYWNCQYLFIALPFHLPK
uniref:Uncharacterized protein n=1 Tax=Anguilla anguilla TaxID=7936 RepID=A0A0E9PY94_ANGAN